MGLLFMPYILKLEFKSKEELQLMPQTTEEHKELEHDDDDDDKSDSEKNLDGEVSAQIIILRKGSNFSSNIFNFSSIVSYTFANIT